MTRSDVDDDCRWEASEQHHWLFPFNATSTQTSRDSSARGWGGALFGEAEKEGVKRKYPE